MTSLEAPQRVAARALGTDTPGSELAARRERLRQALTENAIVAACITAPRDLLYFAGVISGGVLVIPIDGEPKLVAHRVAARVQPLVPFEVRPLRGRDDMREALQARATDRVGFVGSRLSFVQHAQLQGAANPAELIDVSGMVDELRMCKSDWEIAQIGEAAKQAHEAIGLASRLLRTGRSDLEIQLAIEAWLRKAGHPGLGHGAANEGTSVLVLAGPDAAIPAYFNAPLGGPGIASSAPAGPRGHKPASVEPVIVDLVGHHAGYFADQTRTLVRGELPSTLAHAFSVCEEALGAMEGCLRAGIPIRDVYRAGAKVIESTGLLQHWMGERAAAVRFVGHGIGLGLSEPPYVTEHNDSPLELRTVVALEPKLIFEGIGAVGVEHTYLVEADGCRQLTLDPHGVTERSGLGA